MSDSAPDNAITTVPSKKVTSSDSLNLIAEILRQSLRVARPNLGDVTSVEPEAALDEANVERFAKFAKSLNAHSQVIVTTHRPGTMELADVIYGVTMQKKGITKIVTVKLEDAVEMAK